MPVSNVQNSILLDITFPATGVFLGLHTGDPGPLGALFEVTNGGYVRQPVFFAAPAADGAIANSAPVIFLGMPEILVGVTDMSLWNAIDGDCLWYGPITGDPVPFAAEDVAVVLAGALVLTLDPPLV